MTFRIRSSDVVAIIATLAAALLAVVVLSAGEAEAHHVACGATITTDTTLDSDLADCPDNGIVIGADDVTLGDGVFVLSRPPFESEVRYEVSGDTATFDLVVPKWRTRSVVLERLSVSRRSFRARTSASNRSNQSNQPRRAMDWGRRR